MEWLSDPQIWASLLTLTALEIVLGIDNLVFIAILAGRLPMQRHGLPREDQAKFLVANARRLYKVQAAANIIRSTWDRRSAGRSSTG